MSNNFRVWGLFTCPETWTPWGHCGPLVEKISFLSNSSLLTIRVPWGIKVPQGRKRHRWGVGKNPFVEDKAGAGRPWPYQWPHTTVTLPLALSASQILFRSYSKKLFRFACYLSSQHPTVTWRWVSWCYHWESFQKVHFTQLHANLQWPQNSSA